MVDMNDNMSNNPQDSAQFIAQIHFPKLLKKISILPERTMRREVLGEFLQKLDERTLLELLQLICDNSAKTTRHALLFLALQDQAYAVNQLSYEERRKIYQMADDKGYEKVKKLFLSFAPAQIQDPPPPGHHKLSGMPLGMRKFLARRRDINLLEKLLLDPDPTVIRNLLKNPRITEKEVLYICTRRPNNAAVLEEVAQHPKWFQHYPVKLALCKTPYTPVHIVKSALPFLATKDLVEILSMKNLHPEVLQTAQDILDSKS